jgi:hypothetical protein
VTDLDYQHEQQLRTLMAVERSAHVASVLADFYEQRGQLSRAELWRVEALAKRRRRVADLVIYDTKWRRKTMLWLLAHFTSHKALASTFKSSSYWVSTSVHEVDAAISAAANAERHHPTLRATLRLQSARALPPRYVRGAFQLGDAPPESWPVTRDCELPAARAIRNQASIASTTPSTV